VSLLFLKLTTAASVFSLKGMPKRKHTAASMKDTKSGETTSSFRVTTAPEARSLTDGVKLSNGVILPWVGYGTYKLGKEHARECTFEALRRGYRCIDTAFIYSGETTERNVGLALQDAISKNILKREDVFIITKHWRAYHGYDLTNECLSKSLKRLQVNSIDLWLMHWPGPAWNTMNRRNDVIAEKGPWAYAHQTEEEMPHLRAETWRAMEDAVVAGKVKAIGVSNFTIKHLERLKETATMWPPAVNQVEFHPLYPQEELLEYCKKEGIIVQAYASLGGQGMFLCMATSYVVRVFRCFIF
jgi:diketogulonate reductase-like aldo/keto reductase